jgi:hypothetical protein
MSYNLSYAQVAIKRLRVRSQDEETNQLVKVNIVSIDIVLLTQGTQYLSKELQVWKRINHPNILPLYGLTYKMGTTLPAMVCPWQEQGNLSQYLEGRGMHISIHDRYDIVSKQINVELDKALNLGPDT